MSRMYPKWTSYITQIKINNDVLISPLERKCLLLSLKIEVPIGSCVLMCQDNETSVYVPFSFLDVSNDGKIKVNLINKTNNYIRLKRTPIVLNVFAISCNVPVIITTPVKELKELVITNHMVSSTKNETLTTYKAGSKICFCIKTNWKPKLKNSTFTRFVSSAWTFLYSFYKAHPFNCAFIEHISLNGGYIKNICIYDNSVLLFDICIDKNINDPEPLPSDVFISILFQNHDADLVTNDNCDPYIIKGAHPAELSVYANTDMLIKPKQQTSITYDVKYTSSSLNGVFLPLFFNGIEVYPVVWNSESNLSLPLRGGANTVHIRRGQLLGKIYLFSNDLFKTSDITSHPSLEESSSIILSDHVPESSGLGDRSRPLLSLRSIPQTSTSSSVSETLSVSTKPKRAQKKTSSSDSTYFSTPSKKPHKKKADLFGTPYAKPVSEKGSPKKLRISSGDTHRKTEPPPKSTPISIQKLKISDTSDDESEIEDINAQIFFITPPDEEQAKGPLSTRTSSPRIDDTPMGTPVDFGFAESDAEREKTPIPSPIIFGDVIVISSSDDDDEKPHKTRPRLVKPRPLGKYSKPLSSDEDVNIGLAQQAVSAISVHGEYTLRCKQFLNASEPICIRLHSLGLTLPIQNMCPMKQCMLTQTNVYFDISGPAPKYITILEIK